MINDDDFDILEVDTPFDGYFRIDRCRFRHRRHDRGWSAKMVREVFERRHAGAVLPYDPEHNWIVLIEQVRIGALAGGGPLRPIEVVAGVIEPGESVNAVARRETLEETGLTVEDLIPASAYYVSPGGSSDRVTTFIAWVDAGNAGDVHGNRAEGKEIRVQAWTYDDAMTALEHGRVDTATAVTTLQWFALNRGEVRRRWR